jgi:predicted nucleic-acid-binding protein
MEERKSVIALDTNIVVRFLVDDDPVQADIASALVNHPEGIFIAKTTLLELEWVLRHVYQIDKKTLAAGLVSLLGLPNATVESVSQVAEAMKDFAKGMDFADALHLASTHGGMLTYTFDKKFAKLATPRRVVLAKRKTIRT